MTLQTSGAITLAQIQTEFGGADPISMSEYYAGGAYVPSGTSGTNGAVPTSGQISFSQFYGTSDVVFTGISDATYEDYAVGTGTQVNFQIASTGSVNVAGLNLGTLATYTWVSPGSASSNYWVRVTATSGTFGPPGDSTGTWLSLASSRIWYRSRASVGSSTVTATVEIATDSSGTNIIDTATVTLVATVDA